MCWYRTNRSTKRRHGTHWKLNGVIGVLSAIIAALYAVFERDDGRALGWSSVSQLGLAILSPSYACIYAMQHGICKTLLFTSLSSPIKDGEAQELEQGAPSNVPEWLLVAYL